MNPQGNTNGTQVKTNVCSTLGGGQMPGSTIRPGWKLFYAGNDFNNKECYRLDRPGWDPGARRLGREHQ